MRIKLLELAFFVQRTMVYRCDISIYIWMMEKQNTLPFTGDWRDYPFFAQHQLSSTSIECLFKLELNKSGSVDHCYQFTPWLRELYESGWEILQQTLKWHGLFGWLVSFGTSPFQVDKVSSFSLSSCECPVSNDREKVSTTPWEKSGKHPTAASNVFLRQAVELQLINWVHATRKTYKRMLAFTKFGAPAQSYQIRRLWKAKIGQQQGCCLPWREINGKCRDFFLDNGELVKTDLVILDKSLLEAEVVRFQGSAGRMNAGH